MKTNTAILVSALLSLTATSQIVRMEDRSDWWSIRNEKFHEPDVSAQSEELDGGNFKIAGLVLEKDEIEQVEARLGKAKIVQRGEASSGREQVCYVSKNPAKLHLIFEFGEVGSAFYLFEGGAAWKGSEFCAASEEVSAMIHTPSGLTLGLTTQQLEAILGKPDFVTGDRLIYFRETEKKTSPEEFERMRREYPARLSDEAAHERFDSYTLDAYIEARFAGSRLNYLAVSSTATI